MLKIKQAVIVEGKYDKIKLSSFLDAVIITTDGFGLFSDSGKRALIKKLAAGPGIVVITDPDRAGRRIRALIANVTGGRGVVDIHVPKISGRERRKSESSKEGVLGVEGIDAELLSELFRRYGVAAGDSESPAGSVEARREITKTDFYLGGFSGGEGSSEKRRLLAKLLDLPEMPANSLLAAINIVCTAEEYRAAAEKVREKFEGK